MENDMKLELLAVSENESFARSAVAAFALSLNPTLTELSDIKTAVSEAVTNCIVHAYANGGENNRIIINANRHSFVSRAVATKPYRRSISSRVKRLLTRYLLGCVGSNVIGWNILNPSYLFEGCPTITA